MNVRFAADPSKPKRLNRLPRRVSIDPHVDVAVTASRCWSPRATLALPPSVTTNTPLRLAVGVWLACGIAQDAVR